MSVSPIQPQDRRPSAKKVTAGSRRRAQERMDADTVGVRIDGVDYVINPHDLTGSLDRGIRQVIGKGFAELHRDLQHHPGIDLLGEFMWAVRYANGERDLSLDEVLDSVNYGSEVEVIENAKPASGPKA